MSFDELMIEVYNNGVPVHELEMEAYSGIYINGEIILNANLECKERLPMLAEEYGHHLTCGKNILAQDTEDKRRIEKHGRKYAYRKITNFNDIIKAYDDGRRSVEEMAEYFNVSERFIVEMFESAKAKYGIYKEVNGRKIYFIPYIYIS